MRVLRVKELKDLLGVSRSTIWRWRRQGVLPPSRQFGPNVVGWLEEEINEWRNSRPVIGSEQSAA